MENQILTNIIKNEPNTIRACVAQEALNCKGKDLRNFFFNLSLKGCHSGMITSLIEYGQTWDFFDVHYKEIEEIRQEWEHLVGKPIKIMGDLKSYLAWFGFQETARKMSCDELLLNIPNLPFRKEKWGKQQLSFSLSP